MNKKVLAFVALSVFAIGASVKAFDRSQINRWTREIQKELRKGNMRRVNQLKRLIQRELDKARP